MPIFLRFRGFYLLLAMVLLGLLTGPSVHGQGRGRAVQLTGIVATGDSLLGVAGATVYVGRTGLGTVSNAYGYFSLAVLTGDSIVIRSLGFASQTIIIPKDYQPKSYSVIIQLRVDALLLGEVRVFPYATEGDFKKAYLALRLPGGTGRESEAQAEEQLLREIFVTRPVGAVANFRQTMQTQRYDYDRSLGRAPNQYSNNPLLNPFNWLRLIRQVKNGELKNKE
jgi:hypothetical protein